MSAEGACSTAEDECRLSKRAQRSSSGVGPNSPRQPRGSAQDTSAEAQKHRIVDGWSPIRECSTLPRADSANGSLVDLSGGAQPSSFTTVKIEEVHQRRSTQLYLTSLGSGTLTAGPGGGSFPGCPSSEASPPKCREPCFEAAGKTCSSFALRSVSAAGSDASQLEIADAGFALSSLVLITRKKIKSHLDGYLLEGGPLDFEGTAFEIQRSSWVLPKLN